MKPIQNQHHLENGKPPPPPPQERYNLESILNIRNSYQKKELQQLTKQNKLLFTIITIDLKTSNISYTKVGVFSLVLV